MNDVKVLLRQLEACVQEELGAQGRALEGLRAQGEALRLGDPAALDACGRRLEGELGSVAARGERRALLIRRLAGAWRVDPRALTLASIAERAGDEGRRLARMRARLREVAAGVARQTRRNALHARLAQRTWGEVLEGVLAGISGQSAPVDGRLVDAEA